LAKKKKVSKKVTPTKKSCCTGNKWAFHLAWILAIILALGGSLGGAWVTMPFWSLVLVVLGLIIGFTHKTIEISPLLLIAIVLALFGGSSLAVIPYIGNFISNAIVYFVTFLTPAVLIVALRKVYAMLG